ncbi:MAG: hypothetical protein LBO67_02220 [Spirochaetaceae bacterium]|jgi:hypothetical protein|nr:hypothetical protein [Spirochaetaceae bacterium]
MKKIFSLLALLAIAGTAVFAQEAPELKISGSVDTGFYLGTTSNKVGDKADDRIIGQEHDGDKAQANAQFKLEGDRFGAVFGFSAEGPERKKEQWGDGTFDAYGWINFLDKKLKVTAGTNGLDFDLANLPLAGLTGGVHFNFADREIYQETALEFFSETEFLVDYTMADLFTAGITINLDGTVDDSELYDGAEDGDFRVLSPYNLWAHGVNLSSPENSKWYPDNKDAPAYDPTAAKLVVKFGLKAVKDLTADLDLTFLHLGSLPGKLFKDAGVFNQKFYYRNAAASDAVGQAGLGAIQIHAKVGYKLLDGKLGLSLDPTFFLYTAEQEEWDELAVSDEIEKYLKAFYSPALKIKPEVSYQITDNVSAAFAFTLLTKFDYYTKIAVEPSLKWKVLPNATIGFSFKLENKAPSAVVTDVLGDIDPITTTETKVTFGFTF